MAEDDVGVATFVRKGLREAGNSVDWVNNGRDVVTQARNESYDIIVLDLMLPGKNGFDILRELRSADVMTPVICLTARDSVDDRVKGLNLGADDYLVKPFSFSELHARMHALLRRGQTLATKPIVVHDLTIDLLNRSVCRGGKRVDLSPREFSILEFLGRNSGRVLTRTMILERVWDMHQDPLTNVIDVHINRLRRKIDNGHPKCLIHTIRGVGYVLREDD